MRIYALDVATNTGWATCTIERPGQFKGIQSGTIRCTGDSPEQKSWDLSQKLCTLFQREGGPQWVVIEQPLRNVTRFKKKFNDMVGGESEQTTINPAVTVMLNSLVGGVVGTLATINKFSGKKLNYVVVPSQTWRKGFFGTRKPGEKENWKHLAKQQCEMLKIDVSSQDEAESVGILYWACCSCDMIKADLMGVEIGA